MMTTQLKLPILLLAGASMALLLALGLAGWIRHAADLMLSLGEAGLSWCL